MKTKGAALQSFFSSFGIPAYISDNVPDEAILPYITYTPMFDSFNHEVTVNAILWLETESEAAINKKVAEIEQAVKNGGAVRACENGALWIRKGHPWCQYLNSGNTNIRERYLTFIVEFFTS